MKCVILCAGKGERLHPLTKNMPKCLVSVAGKPIIQHTLDTLFEIEVKPEGIIMITGYKEDILKDYLSQIKCYFVTQEKINGTANAIYLAKDLVGYSFIVLSGDIIYEKDDLMKLMQIQNSLLYTKQDERLFEYGTLDVAGDKIMSINEKSTEPMSNLVNCGAYHFTQDVFDYIPKTAMNGRFDERIITNTINLMIKDGIWFTGIPIKYLNEISRPEDIKKVEERL